MSAGPRTWLPAGPADPQVEPVPDSGPEGVRAAGAVLWRRVGDGVEVALVHRPRYGDWSLPKGKLEPGEHPLAAAAREVWEETGYRVALGRPLGAQRYPVSTADGRTVPKIVHYWAGRALDGVHVPGAEVDALHWLAPEEAAARLSYPRDRELLTSFTAVDVDTTAVVLLRHAHAVGKSRWKKPDVERPLSTRGRGQAAALVGVLVALGPLQARSSPAQRCLETIAPYAERAEAAVVADSRLAREAGEGGGPAEVAVEALRAAAAGTGTLLCTHREDLPGLLIALGEAGLPGAPTGLGKAGVLVAHVDAAGRVLVAQHHRL